MDQSLQLSLKQARAMMAILIAVIVFTAWDLFVDTDSGVDIQHAVIEGGLIFVSALGVFSIGKAWLQSAREQFDVLNKKLGQSVQENVQLQSDLQKYKEESASYIKGLSLAIDRQFSDWKLSDSEKEIGLLLLKGLSHKEIAEIRGTSEKTVRHQSGSLYQKASLEGRAQLAAFFLEDLLLPSEKM